MIDMIAIVVIAILFKIAGCEFPDTLIMGFLAVIYLRVRELEVKE